MRIVAHLAWLTALGISLAGCSKDDDDDTTTPEGGSAGATAQGGSGNADQGGSGNADQGGSGNTDQGGSGNTEQGGSGNAEQGGSGNAEQGGSGNAEQGGSESVAGQAGSVSTQAGSGGEEQGGAPGTAGAAGAPQGGGAGGAAAGAPSAGAGGATPEGGAAGAPDVAEGGAAGAAPAPVTSELAQLEVEGAELTAGDLPETTDADVTPEIEGPDEVTNGSTATYTITVPEGAVSILIKVTGDSGYYTIPANPDENGEQQVSLTLLPDYDEETLEVTIATVDADGEISSTASKTLAVTLTGTGEVKVTLTFDQSEDLDLAVVDPDGDQVDFGAPTSPSGGELDLDSNAACNIDGVNAENVYWEDAPRGNYIIGVRYYAVCSEEVTEVAYTLTVTVGDEVSTQAGVLNIDQACYSAEGEWQYPDADDDGEPEVCPFEIFEFTY